MSTIVRLDHRFPRFHKAWHRDIYRSCLICRFIWWRLSRQAIVKEWLAEIDASRSEVASHDDDVREGWERHG